MDLFTLILTVSIFTSNGSVPGVAVSTTSVPGFATMDDCNQAGINARIPSDRRFYEVDKTYLCVQVKAS